MTLGRKITEVVLWIVTSGFALFGILTILGVLDGAGQDPAGRGFSQALGVILLLIAGAAAVALYLGRKSVVGLILAGLIVGLPFAVFAWFTISQQLSEKQRLREVAEMRSGKYDFGDQPGLLAVANAIAQNDQAAIRAAAKNLPDLQAPGREGKTLLVFALMESWRRPELAEAVKTLLEAGADPNFTSASEHSFAMESAVCSSVLVLRTMLDAGGNPNALASDRMPIIFWNWRLSYFEADQRQRLDLLIERGADVNSTTPPDQPFRQGYPLVLFRADAGRGDGKGYADALHLLERGADPHRAAVDGTTLATLLQEHRAYFSPEVGPPPAQFALLWEWARSRGLLQ